MRALKKTNLSEQLILQLAESIREGELDPGDRLPSERELAKRMKVSRATVREGLRVMESHGLIAIRPGSGTFIANGSPEGLAIALSHIAVRDVFELRRLLEPSICFLAAERATPDDLSRLESILTEQERSVGEQRTSADVDGTFHRALAEATHNIAIVQLGAALIDVIALSRAPSYQTRQRALNSLDSHQRILGAIKAHAPEKARHLMDEHIRLIESTLFEPTPESLLKVSYPVIVPLDTPSTRLREANGEKLMDTT